MWLQGAELVEKQPGMAYALASVALSVGELQPLLWGCLLAALRTECCYNVPHYPALPPKGVKLRPVCFHFFLSIFWILGE